MKNELMTAQIDIQKKVGKNILAIREKKGLSQIDVASKMLGRFDATNMSRIEAGRTNATLFTFYRISEAMEVSLAELFNFNED